MPKKKPFAWRPFLKKVSRDLLKDVRIREDLPEDVVASGWLGYSGASEAEIAALEKRLRMRLPPSYRTFLAETNGWRQCGSFIYKLWSCTEVRRFRERNQDWIDAYVHPDWGDEEAPEPPPISDEEYLVYGKKQDSCRFRTEYLQTALEISDRGDSAILLLNPKIIGEDGEWEAWLFANWMPGAKRYRSFRELMEADHRSFCRHRKELGPSKSKYGNAAQQAARRGETEAAMSMLRELASGGDESSAVSLAELCAFRGLWDDVIVNLERAIFYLGAIPCFYMYPADLIRLLARSAEETGQWRRVSEVAGKGIRAGVQTGWLQNLQAYCKRRGKPPKELIYVVGVPDPVDALTVVERRARYDRAMMEEHTTRLKNKPDQYTCHTFAIARNMKLDDEAIRIYEERPSAIYFHDALDVSRAYVKTGNQRAAWEVIQARLPQSVGGVPEQVAPIILLVDELLRPLMTRDRCDLVLSTPRGREAANKSNG